MRLCRIKMSPMSWQDIVRIDAPTEHSLSGTGEKTFPTEMSVCEEDSTQRNKSNEELQKKTPFRTFIGKPTDHL